MLTVNISFVVFFYNRLFSGNELNTYNAKRYLIAAAYIQTNKQMWKNLVL
jgi:hypothetical protein